MTTIAIILAGGLSARVKDVTTPKQYHAIGKETLLSITMHKFLQHSMVDFIIPVIHQRHRILYNNVLQSMKKQYIYKLLPPVIGGGSRMLSSCAGVCSIKGYLESGCIAEVPDKILIHDAARPFVSCEIISSVIDALDMYDVVDVGVQITDTIKERICDGGERIRTLQRDKLYATQTPQGMHYTDVVELYTVYHDTNLFSVQSHDQEIQSCATDDVTFCMQKNGLKITVVAGDVMNFKITTQGDLKYAEYILQDIKR